nr:ANTAR domain-containing protein [Cellulomonas sp. URHD0024]
MTDLSPSGRFRIPTAEPAGRWWWSDGLFAIHGMSAGEVVPTQRVFLSHVHPDDLSTVLSVLGHAFAAPDSVEPHSCEYRLRDLQGAERVVVLAVSSDDATSGVISGSVVDVTQQRHRVVAESVNDQLSLALEAHAAIDQAKGILMVALGMDSAEAFSLLRSCSQRLNIRIRALAERLVNVAAAADADALEQGHLIDILVSLLRGDHSDPLKTISADGFAVTAERAGSAPVLRVTGRMDVSHAIRLGVAIRLVQLDAGACRVVVDLRGVEVTDAPALAALAEAARSSADTCSRVVVLGGDAVTDAERPDPSRHRSHA